RYDTDHQWQSSVDNKGNLVWNLTSATNTPEFTFSDPVNISTSIPLGIDVFDITASTTQSIIDIKSSSTDYLIKVDQMGDGGIFDFKQSELSVLSLSNAGVLNLQNASSTQSIFSLTASSSAPLVVFDQKGAGSSLLFGSSPQASSTISLLQLTANPMTLGSVNGTFIAANPASFSGNFMDFQVAGTRYFSLASDGDIFTAGGFLMSVNSTTAVSIQDTTGVTHFVIDTTQGHYGFATSSPADGFGLTIATSTLQYGDYYNFGNATTTGTGVFFVSLSVATTTHPYGLNVSGSGYFTDGLMVAGYTTTSDLYVQGNNTTTQSLVLGTGATNLIDYADGDLLVSDDAVISGSATTSGTFIVSTAFGINTTTLPYTFNVSGTSYFTDGLLIAGYTTTSDLYVQGSATTTGTQIVSTAFGVNTTTLNTTFNVDGDTLLYGNATTTGSYYVGNDLTVANSVVLGDATSDTLTVNSTVDSDLIPQSNAYNLGSTANRWGTIYGDTINASNIVANNTEIGGTKAADFTINSDNATSDTENMSLTFKRGLPVTNAVLGWNAAKHQFTLNFPIWIEGTDSGGAASSTIVVKEGVNQGGVDLFKLLDISNNILLRADPEGHFAVGASYQDGYGFTVATTTYIEGQCVTGDTVLPIVRVNNIEYVRIDEIKGGEYVMSLNEKTGLLEPARINGLLDMGVKPIYKLTTESGKTIRTTGNHPY
ncbi:hypothetical protein KKE07_05200, partial [Candidatus Dependentiae bacterium]|nr:hypothetical protein [Candidatus Dependentiae bacterium]